MRLAENNNEFSRSVHGVMAGTLLFVAGCGVLVRGEAHHAPGPEHPAARERRERHERIDDKRHVDEERERRDLQEQNNPNPAPPVVEERMELI